jgi:hypothetical protein
VANVAGYGNLGSIEDTTIEDFRAQIDTNLFGTIHLSKAAIPIMRARRTGHILNFSSVGGRVGSTGRAPYSAAKFGVEGFSEAMVTELTPLGVKVTIFEPGGFRTDFAGLSQIIHKIRPEYEPTVGQAARFQRDYNGKQPGDPAKAAQVILKVVGMDDPPLRLLLGSDAVRIVETADARKAETDPSGASSALRRISRPDLKGRRGYPSAQVMEHLKRAFDLAFHGASTGLSMRWRNTSCSKATTSPRRRGVASMQALARSFPRHRAGCQARRRRPRTTGTGPSADQGAVRRNRLPGQQRRDRRRGDRSEGRGRL